MFSGEKYWVLKSQLCCLYVYINVTTSSFLSFSFSFIPCAVCTNTHSIIWHFYVLWDWLFILQKKPCKAFILVVKILCTVFLIFGTLYRFSLSRSFLRQNDTTLRNINTCTASSNLCDLFMCNQISQVSLRKCDQNLHVQQSQNSHVVNKDIAKHLENC